MSFVFQTKNLFLGYGGNTILSKVSFVVHEGEFWFFLGPNGKGKSTLLKSLLGLVPPKSGEINWNPDFGRKEFYGFIPQRWELNPTIPTTVREFVELGLVGLNLDKKEREGRFSWALNKVGFDTPYAFDKKDFWSLSDGQRQRTCVARALIRNPKVLFADEPTIGLDLSSETELLTSLSKLNRQEKLTIIFVSHDLSLAVRYASHIALFTGGEVKGGMLKEILTPENLEQTYGVNVNIYREKTGKGFLNLEKKKS